MKVTKYVHSCLLVEEGNLRVLIDPGNMSWDSHLLNPDEIGELSHIVITHEHADHYHEPALKALSKRSPHAQIVTNNDLAKDVEKLKLPNPITSESSEDIIIFEAPHAPLPLGLPSPLNIGVHIAGKLTHSGDAIKFSHTRDILAMPITGPFAGLTQTLKEAVKVKPKVFLPIHDWHWHKQARVGMYGWSKGLLAKHGINFIELENAEPVEL